MQVLLIVYIGLVSWAGRFAPAGDLATTAQDIRYTDFAKGQVAVPQTTISGAAADSSARRAGTVVGASGTVAVAGGGGVVDYAAGSASIPNAQMPFISDGEIGDPNSGSQLLLTIFLFAYMALLMG